MSIRNFKKYAQEMRFKQSKSIFKYDALFLYCFNFRCHVFCSSSSSQSLLVHFGRAFGSFSNKNLDQQNPGIYCSKNCVSFNNILYDHSKIILFSRLLICFHYLQMIERSFPRGGKKSISLHSSKSVSVLRF